MTIDSDTQVKALIVAVSNHSGKNLGKYLTDTNAASEVLLSWLSYLRNNVSTGRVDELLDGSQAAIIEVAGCLSLGLVRPAIFSMRAQLEILLAWIYFNDHLVEWRSVFDGERDHPLRGQFLKYMKDYSGRFSKRFDILSKNRQRKNEDPYRILSIHVHCTSTFALPNIGPLSSLVKSDVECTECVQLQGEVAEYLTDILASWYADRWQDLPLNVQESIEKRLNPAKLKIFCS